MKNQDIEQVKKSVGFFGDLLANLGEVLTPIVGLFGSQYTAPVVAVSAIAKEFGKLNDEDINVLQNNVLGLSGLIEQIEHEVELSSQEEIQIIHTDTVRRWLVELKSINELRKLNNKILD